MGFQVLSVMNKSGLKKSNRNKNAPWQFNDKPTSLFVSIIQHTCMQSCNAVRKDTFIFIQP